MLVVAGIAIGIVVGVVAAVVTIAMLEKSRLGELRRRRTLLITEAEREAEAIRREAQIETRERELTLRAEIEDEVRSAPHGDRADRGAHRDARAGPRPEADRAVPARAGSERPRARVEGAARGAEAREGAGAARAREARGHDAAGGARPSARPLGGARPARARASRATARRGGARGGEAPRAEPRRGRAAAGRRQPRGRDDRLDGRAAERRHEGADHRPRGPEHPRARAPDGRRLHHRRHAAGRRALVVRRDPARDREADAPEAHRGRAHPPGADRGDVLPVEVGARRPRPAGRRAGRVRGELRRLPPGDRQDPRPAPLPDELRAERAEAHARGRAPRRRDGDRARGGDQDGQARRAAPRRRARR